MLLSFCSTAAKKACFSHIALHCCRESSPQKDTGHQQDWRVYTTKLRVVAAKFEGRRWSVSRGLASDMGPDPFLYQRFAMQNTRPFSIRKRHPEMGQAPTSQARPQDTDHLQPSHLAARTLSLVEHMLSTFGGDPCPVRRRLVAAVMCYVRKQTFFL